jgi:hypothetical protein
MNNLAGRAEMKDAQQTLMAALQEKIVIDSDFVPPVLQEAVPPARPARKKQ